MFLRSSKLLQNLVWSFLPFIGQYLCCFACGAGSCGCSFPPTTLADPPRVGCSGMGNPCAGYLPPARHQGCCKQAEVLGLDSIQAGSETGRRSSVFPRSCSLGQLRRICSKLVAYCLLQNMSCTRRDRRGPGRSLLSPGKHHTGPQGLCRFPVQGWGLFSAVMGGQAPPAHCSCPLGAGPFPDPWALLQVPVGPQLAVAQQLWP